MYLINYKFFNNNILRGILLRKYGLTNTLQLSKLNRIIFTIEIKDKEENISLENFIALNILTHIVKIKSGCIAQTSHYKFGQKHTFVFQAILRGQKLLHFLNFFCLNNLFLISKKQLDLQMYFNEKKNTVLFEAKDISFFSQLPVEFFKWDAGIKFSLINSKNEKGIKINDLCCFLQGLNFINTQQFLKKIIFYNEVFNYKR